MIRDRLIGLLCAVAAAIAIVGEAVTADIERWEVITTAAAILVFALADALRE